MEIRAIPYGQYHGQFVDPNCVLFPQTLREVGFRVYSDTYRANGNLPGLHCIGPEGATWTFDGCFHLWNLALYLVPECDRVYA
jgi:hypothetical protein